jgi:tetratricopeptide (TPR) repeat protein
MEDHREAYFFWKELGLRDQACLHVDAHLDVSNLKAPAYETAERPEMNCGNFLLPALQEGALSSLVWVVPDHLPGGEDILDWTRLELQNWMRLDLSDYMSLEKVDERVEGRLLNKPFTVCRSEDTPEMQHPFVLDIDIDYFLDPDDELWQSPVELVRNLGCSDPTATTIAYSVQGGYTPVRYRYLAPLTELALKDPDSATEIWDFLQSGRADFPPRWPDWTRPTDALPVKNIDKVSAALMRGMVNEAERHLEEVEDGRERTFMKGLLALRKERLEEASESWEALFADRNLEKSTRLYLLTTCGRAQLAAEQYGQAYETLARARGLARNDSEVLALQARACVGLGRTEEAARLFRNAIKLSPELLETAQTRLELAELYLKRGQNSLAERLLHQTLAGDTPGFMKVRAEALKLRLALGMNV